ncbi:MAG: metallophosphoesterase family protein [Candidatus Riflebacteria bacterium]|nr:metallophosphoesterase family protein [Candidatus Riflebacteria bacterium]
MIAIISDVHGNYPALCNVLEEIDKIGCKMIISLGDVAGYYCMVNDCIDEFRRRNIINLLGNHDSYLLGMGKCPRSTTVNRCIDYQKEIITSENLDYLRKSLAIYDFTNISLRHGGWTDPIDEYVNKFDFEIANNSIFEIFGSGHSHIQSLQEKDGITYFNPGSVGQPRDNNPKAAFAIIDNNKVKLYRIDYDIDSIAKAMLKAGFEERTYDCLYHGTKIGGNG